MFGFTVEMCLTQLVRMPLAEAGPEVRMVESLQSMWDEEKLRIGSSPPPPPPEPIRTPTPLCQHIEVVRAQLQVCATACQLERCHLEGSHV